MIRKIAAGVAAGLLALSGTAYAADVAISTTTGGHAKNVDASDWRYHVYGCDTKDDGHQMQVQAHMGNGETFRATDSMGGGCAHIDGNTIVNNFRICRLMIFDECGSWVTPKRDF